MGKEEGKYHTASESCDFMREVTSSSLKIKKEITATSKRVYKEQYSLVHHISFRKSHVFQPILKLICHLNSS